MDAGIQLHLPTYAHIGLPRLVQLARRAHEQGVTQIWATDNLRSRNTFVVLTAIGCAVPVRLGTAVAVQYFRNPVELADAAAAISEVMLGDELSVGLGRGNPRTSRFVDTPKPVAMLRETAGVLRQLLDGASVQFDAYPTVREYFRLQADTPFKLNFSPQAPVRLYCGSNGPLGLRIGGSLMDGLIYSGRYIAASTAGDVPAALAAFDQATRDAGRFDVLPKVAEIKISISRDGPAAREFVRVTAGRRLLGMVRGDFSQEQIARLGVSAGDVALLDEAEASGASDDALRPLVSDAMVDAIFIAGDQDYCRGRMADVIAMAKGHGFGQLMFSGLGPQPEEAIELIADEILPLL